MNRESTAGRRLGPRWAVAALGALALLLTGCGAGVNPPGEDPIPSVIPIPSATVPPMAPRFVVTLWQPTNSRSLSGRVYSMAYDPFRNAIWYDVMVQTNPLPAPPAKSGNGTQRTPIRPLMTEGSLFEVNAESGQIITTFGIPNPAYDAGTSDDVRVAPDGSIWIAESYSLVRVDPSTRTVSTVTLPLNVAGSLKNPANGGTYATSLTFTSNSALLARNNVQYLQQWSLSMKPLANVALPAGDAGANDMTTTSTGISLMVPRPAPSSADRMVKINLPAGTTAPTGPHGTALEPPYLEAGPVAPGKNASLLYLDGVQRLGLDASGTGTALTVRLVWVTSAVWADVVVPVGIPWPVTVREVANALGEMVPARSWPELSAALVLPDDALWIVTNPGNCVLLQQFRAPTGSGGK